MKQRIVTIKLIFNEDGSDSGDVKTNDVPKTIIVEWLQAITKGLCQDIVSEAKDFIPEEGLERYLNARIKVDRDNLKNLFK